MRLFFRPLFTSYEHGAITISRNKEGSICQTGISGLSRLKRYRLSRTIRKYTQNKKQHVMVIEDSLHLDAARARRAAMTPPIPPPPLKLTVAWECLERLHAHQNRAVGRARRRTVAALATAGGTTTNAALLA